MADEKEFIVEYTVNIVKAITVLAISGLAWKVATWIVQGIIAL